VFAAARVLITTAKILCILSALRIAKRDTGLNATASRETKDKKTSQIT
jgi:hypothetical protein